MILHIRYYIKSFFFTKLLKLKYSTKLNNLILQQYKKMARKFSKHSLYKKRVSQDKNTCCA